MASSSVPPASIRRVILVVEDDQPSAKGLERLLRDDGFDVHVAHDGQVAIQWLNQAEALHALVTDIAIPFTNGRVVADRARRRFPSARIVFVSAYVDLLREVSAASEKDGYQRDRMLNKPLSYHALREAVDTPALAPAVRRT